MTSLALGNIEIDQAVVNAIVAIIAAANVTLGRMTPTSGSIISAWGSLAPFVQGECELPHTGRRFFASVGGPQHLGNRNWPSRMSCRWGRSAGELKGLLVKDGVGAGPDPPWQTGKSDGSGVADGSAIDTA